MIKIPKDFLHNSFKLLGQRGLKWFSISLSASVGIAVVELCISIIIQLLLISLGFLSANSNAPYLNWVHLPLPVPTVMSILCLIAIARFVVQLLSTQSVAFIKDHVSYRLRQNSVHQMLFAVSSETRIASDINYKISEIFVKSSDFIFFLALFLGMSIQISFLFLIMFFVAWKETCIAFIGVIGIGLLVLFINKNVSKFAKLVPIEQKKLNEGIQKIARNFIFIKLMKKRQEEYNVIQESIAEYSAKSILSNFFSNLSSQTGPFLGIILLIFIILLSQNLWHTSPLTLISFIYLLSRFVQSLSILSGYFGNTMIFFPQYRIALETIKNPEFNTASEDKNNKISLIGSRSRSHTKSKNDQLITPEANNITELQIQSPSPAIKFESMFFSYPNSSIPIFQNLNFIIEGGSQLGIIGPSGSGKSTLLMLITGILKPTSGRILINNLLASNYISQDNIRIGYVGAEPFLIKGNLKENLCYGLSRQVPNEEITQALEMVSLKSLIDEKGLDYLIGEDHSGVSAGQKQRICLARAILNKPSLLILDEATANLDETNEKQVAEILLQLKGKCTTIIVSHRPGILLYADKLLEMSQISHH